MSRKPPPPGSECYSCDKRATNWEHAPPKGFFPTRKHGFRDSAGRDHRKNLVMVPSCDDHNNPKSQSDDYAMTVVGIMSAVYGGGLNEANPHPFALDLIRRVQRGPRLRASIIESATPVVTSAGKLLSAEVDTETINEVIEATVRALFFHEHGWARRWPGRCHVHNPHFRMPDLASGPAANEIELAISGFDEQRGRAHPGWALKGEHPDVFAYQLAETAPGRPSMRLLFYGVFTFLAFSDDPTAPILASG